MKHVVLSNPKAQRIKDYHRLLDKKQRERTGLMLVEGINAVEQLIKYHPHLVQDILVDINVLKSNPRIKSVLQLLTNSSTLTPQKLVSAAAGFGRPALPPEINTVSEGSGECNVPSTTDAQSTSKLSCTTPDMNVKLSTREVLDAVSVDAAGVVAVAKTLIEVPETNLAGPVVVLNNVRDPGNVGAIVRVAVALGASKVLFAGEFVDHWNPKVVRSSVGAVFQIPIQSVPNLQSATDYLRSCGFQIAAADMHGTPNLSPIELKQWQPSEQQAVVFGNEAHGLTEAEVDLCDQCVYIKLSAQIESLNLAGSVHIFLYKMLQ